MDLDNILCPTFVQIRSLLRKIKKPGTFALVNTAIAINKRQKANIGCQSFIDNKNY